MIKRITSILLAFTMIFTTLGADVLAAERADNSHIISENSDTLDSELYDNQNSSSTGFEALERQLQELQRKGEEAEKLKENGEVADTVEEGISENIAESNGDITEPQTDDNADIANEDGLQEELGDEETANDSDNSDASEQDDELTVIEEEETAEAHELAVSDGFIYYIEDDYAHIIGYEGSDSDITVPVRINGHIVSAIDRGAFSEDTGVSSVNVSFYVKDIAESAFSNGITIKSYFGSAAMKYADNYGLAFENLSQLDFADGVLDMTDIIRSHYSFTGDLTIEMNVYEAGLLSVGSVFYLPPSSEVPNGDGFKVVSMDRNGDSVILRCERALGGEILNRLIINEQNLKPDWNSAIFFFDVDEDGIYEEYKREDALQNENGDMLIESEDGEEIVKWSYGGKVDVSPEIALKIPLMNKESKKDKDIKNRAYLNFKYYADLDASVDIDVDFLGLKVNKYNASLGMTQNIKGSVSYKRDYSGQYNSNQVPNYTKDPEKDMGKCIKTFPLAVVPIQSSGLEKFQIVLSAVVEVNGEISFTYSWNVNFGTKYNPVTRKFENYSKEYDEKWTVSAKIEMKVGVQASLQFIALSLLESSVSGDLGLKISVSGSTEELNEPQVTVSVGLYLDLTVSVEVGTKKVKFLSENITVNLVDITLWKHTIQKALCTINFCYPGYEIPSQIVALGNVIQEPNIGFIPKRADGAVVIGWTTDNSVEPAVKWNFDEDVVDIKPDSFDRYILNLYPVWGKGYAANFMYGDNDLVYKRVYSQAGELLKEPPEEDMMIPDYRFHGWYKEKDHINKWDFDKDVMPENDIRIYGWMRYEEGYDPYKEIDANYDAQEDFEYTVNGATCKIKKYLGDGGKVIIPEYNGGIKVTGIEKDAFPSDVKSAVTEIVMPGSIKYVDGPAFSGMNNLKKLTTSVLGDTSNSKGLHYLFGPYATNVPSSLTDVTLNIEGEIPGSYMSACDNIKNVVIGPGATSLGKWAFMRCYSLENIEIPGSVKTFGDGVFSECNALQSITLPPSLSEISRNTFYRCRALQNVKLPTNVRSIGDGAFAECTGLSEIEIPETCTYIAEKSFANCKLEKLTTPVFGADSAIRPYTIYKLGIDTDSLKTVVYTGDTLTEGAMSGCTNLTTVEFKGNRLKSIGKWAFFNCTSLHKLEIPDTVTSMAERCFDNSSITDLVMPSVNSLKAMYYDSPHLNSLTVTGNKLCYSMFNDSYVDNLVLSDSITTIQYAAFSGYQGNIGELNLPNVTTIDNSAFERCESLTKLTAPKVKNIGDYAFNGCINMEFNIPKGVERLGKYAFKDCEKIKEITISDNVTAIGERTFENCKSLKAVYLPDSIEQIGDYAFMGCQNLKNVSIPDNVEVVGRFAFQNCAAITEIEIPHSVKKLGDCAFAGCSGLSDLVIPYSVESIGNSVIDGCDLKNLSIENANKIGQVMHLSAENIYINGGSAINKNAFKGSSCKYVYIGSSIRTIGEYAFENSGIEELEIEEGVESIGAYAFKCNNLSRANIPSTVISIAYNAFYGTSMDELIYLSNEVPYYERFNSLYFDWYKPKQVLGRRGSDSEAFFISKGYNYAAIDDLYSGISTSGDGVNAYIRWMDDIHLSGYRTKEKIGSVISMPYIPEKPGYFLGGWYVDSFLTVPWDINRDVVPAEGITLYADWVATDSIIDNFSYEKNSDGISITGYYGTDSIVNIPKRLDGRAVTEIDEVAFAYDDDIVKLVIPASVKRIADDAFDESPRLMQIQVDAANEYFSSVNGVLFSRDKKTLIRFPEGKAMSLYTVPAGVEVIADKAFESSKCSKIVMPDSVKTIGKLSLGRCEGLTEVILGSGIESISPFASWYSDKAYFYGPVGNPTIDQFVKSSGIRYNRYKLVGMDGDDELFTVEMEAGKNIGTYLSESLNAFRKNDSYVKYWKKDSADGAEFDVNTEVMPAEDLVLYAVWGRDFTYEVNSSVYPRTVKVTGYTGSDADAVVPETIGGYKVTSIGDNAFKGIRGLKSIELPDSIDEISASAFESTVTLIADSGSYVESFASSHSIDFKPKKYRIHFETNGGSLVEDKLYSKGATGVTEPVTSRDNYTFTGWFLDNELKTKWNRADYVMPAESVTLYAGWRIINPMLKGVSFDYTEIDGEIVINRYTGTDSTIIIPDKINNIPVTAIGEEAFRDCNVIQMVTIPNSVTAIGDRAFMNCENLQFVEFGTGIETIGTGAFKACVSLTRVDLSDLSGLTEISDRCFENSENILSVTMPVSLERIGDYAFAGCEHLPQINLPESLISIGEYAFYGNQRIKVLTIPKNVNSIGQGFVDNCPVLEQIGVDEKNKTYMAYIGRILAKYVERTYIISGVTRGYKDYYIVRCPEGFNARTEISFAMLSSFEKNSFLNCKGIKVIESMGMPSDYRNTHDKLDIYEGCFKGCENLEYVAFGEMIKKIPDDAFAGCVKLKDIKYKNSNGVVSNQIAINNSITEIGDFAFADCRSLKKIRLTKNVTSIGFEPFVGCNELVIEGYADSYVDSYARSQGFEIEYVRTVSDKPETPELIKVTVDTIELKNIAGCEYSCNGTDWQDSPVFTGLSPFTLYEFTQRVKQTKYAACSEASDILRVQTEKAVGYNVKKPVIMGVYADRVDIATVEGCEYSLNGTDWQDSPVFTGLTPDTSYTVYQRSKESRDSAAGSISSAEFTTGRYADVVISLVSNGSTISSVNDSWGKEYGVLPVPSRAGYMFDGWYTSQAFLEDNRVTQTTVISRKSDHTLYAKWIEGSQVALTFMKGEGSFTGENAASDSVDMAYSYGTRLSGVPVVARQGYRFIGWSETENGCTVDELITEGNVSYFAKDTVLYPQWMPVIESDGEVAGTELIARSVSLKDEIGLNYYFTVNDELIDESDDVCIEFTVDGKTTAVSVEPEDRETVAGAGENGASVDAYKVTFSLPAAKMNSNVSVRLVYRLDGREVQSTKDYSYSVRRYCDDLSDAGYNDVKDALLNYGGFAQDYFGDNSEHANVTVDDSVKAEVNNVSPSVFDGYDHSAAGTQEGISYYGTSLVLKSKCIIRHYFDIADGHGASDYIFLLDDGRVLKPKYDGARYYVDITGIEADDYDRMYQLSVGGMKLSYSVFSYGKLVMSKASDDKLVSLMKAMYLYNQAAKRHF